jgi:hypothetical protein
MAGEPYRQTELCLSYNSILLIIITRFVPKGPASDCMENVKVTKTYYTNMSLCETATLHDQYKNTSVRL